MTTDALALAAIDFYRARLSPRKGFSCAHRVLYGGESCSQHIRRQVTEQGLRAALRDAPVRFRECRRAAQILHAEENVPWYRRGTSSRRASSAENDSAGLDIACCLAELGLTTFCV